MRTAFQYDSRGGGKIHGFRWTPAGEPAAVVQIIHGITDHSERYDQLARYLNSKGILVVAEDHMGHGKTVALGGTKGYFDGGWDAVVEDICKLTEMTQKEYPDIPYFLLGHSMGSFLARTILCRKPDLKLSGVILSGTGWIPDPALKVGSGTAKLLCRQMGERTASKKLNDLVFGSFNIKVERKRTTYDWLSRDAVWVDAYLTDPMCGFPVTCALMRDMAGALREIQDPKALKGMNRHIPILFVSGGDDPVGGFGKAVNRTVQAFRDAGMQRVKSRIFPLCRHELHGEINRAEVFRYLHGWLRETSEAEAKGCSGDN